MLDVKTSEYILHCLLKDSVYRDSMNQWCDDREIQLDDMKDFIEIISNAALMTATVNEFEA